MRMSDWSSDVCSSDLAGGGTRSLEAVLGDIYARDARDSNRAAAPLVQADDADLLDTTELGITAAVQRAIALVEARSEEHTSELQSLMRISYAVFCLKKKTNTRHQRNKKRLTSI